MHSDSQAGLTTGRYGLDRRHASRSALRASGSAKTTNDTSLHTSQTSLPIFAPPSSSESKSPARLSSALLQSVLEARLMERLSGRGSMIYSGGWKQHTTPAWRSISRLRVSARRTSGSELSSVPSGCPTPAANTYGEDLDREMARRARLKEKHGNGAGMTIALAAQMSGWPTPTTRDHKDGSECQNVPLNALLGRVAWLAGPARLTSTGEMLTGSSAGMESGGQLNPAHPRWLMGYPPEWDACAGMAMPSSRKSRRRSSEP